MGAVFKKSYTKPIPDHGELITVKGESFVRVKPPKGRVRIYSVTRGRDGELRMSVPSGTYVAKFRDAQGLVKTVSTGCRDEGAARSVLSDLERRVELIRAGVMTRDEETVADPFHRSSGSPHSQPEGRWLL